MVAKFSNIDGKVYVNNIEIIDSESWNKVIDSITELQQENQQLKKQLEERPKEYFFIGNAQNKTRDFINNITKENTKLLNQQKEFVKYLENEIKRYIPNLKVNEFNEDGSLKAQYINAEVFTKQPIEIVKEILAKYNEIIGGENE